LRKVEINPFFLPVVGYRVGPDGTLDGQGTVGYYRSSSEFSSTHGFALFIDNGRSEPNRSSAVKAGGMSIRCVR